jgi:hypothetical protein
LTLFHSIDALFCPDPSRISARDDRGQISRVSAISQVTAVSCATVKETALDQKETTLIQIDPRECFISIRSAIWFSTAYTHLCYSMKSFDHGHSLRFLSKPASRIVRVPGIVPCKFSHFRLMRGTSLCDEQLSPCVRVGLVLMRQNTFCKKIVESFSKTERPT